MFLKNKRSEGGAVGVVLNQFSKRFRPVAENGNKERHLRSPLEASSQLQKNVIVVVGCNNLPIGHRPFLKQRSCKTAKFSGNSIRDGKSLGHMSICNIGS
jgi:hypothetical protein